MQQSGQRPNLEQVRAIQNSLPPDLLRKMRAAGPAGAQKIMQDYMASGGEGLDMGKMMEMMGGMGGMGGGMPGMPAGLGNLMGGLGGMPGMGGGGMPGEFNSGSSAETRGALMIVLISFVDLGNMMKMFGGGR